MNSDQPFDAVILGAGIAGLSVADALIQKGYHCAIIDRQSPGSGASGAPGMLVNPATGRRAKMSLASKKALPLIADLLSRVQKYSGKEIFEQNGVLRPALYPEIAEDFKRAPEKYNWPEGWIEWIDESIFRERFPVFKKQYGGLIVDKALTVDGSLFIQYLSEYLSQNGLQTYYNTSTGYHISGNSWIISLNSEESIRTRRLICATGSSLTKDPNWSFLNLHLIKGQTATFYFDKPLPLAHSVSSLGYMAFMSKTPKKLVVGSTYEHHFDSPEPDQKGLDYLTEKFDNTFHGWSKNIVKSDQWSGFRVTSKDKKPVIGEHPDLKGLYLAGALGSKGLILGRYIAEQLAGLITENTAVDPAVSVARYF